jgi:putative hydrolase of the HAD superfamily
MDSSPRPAVLFDLFGTLVPGGTRAARDAVVRAAARDLGVDENQFADAFRNTFDDRVHGRLGDVEATLGVLASRLQAGYSQEAVKRAAGRRLDFTRELLAASWALEVLDDLRSAGFAIGVVSDCSAETPTLWADCALSSRVDAVAFSCVLGIRKPDPRIYLAATGQLGADPEDCIFIGDGGSNELSGARRLGMRAIWYDNVGNAAVDRPDSEVGWAGERITDLTQIRELLDGADRLPWAGCGCW